MAHRMTRFNWFPKWFPWNQSGTTTGTDSRDGNFNNIFNIYNGL